MQLEPDINLFSDCNVSIAQLTPEFKNDKMKHNNTVKATGQIGNGHKCEKPAVSNVKCMLSLNQSELLVVRITDSYAIRVGAHHNFYTYDV